MTWTRRDLLAAGVVVTAGCVRAPRARRDRFDAGSADARIGFAGDVMLGRGVNDRWTGRNPAGVWGSTLDRLRSLDGLVANLECCVSDRGERWPDKAYYFRADPAFAAPALASADVSVTALANNHVLDFREAALRDTRAHLSEVGVAHAGAGPDRDAAIELAVVEMGGLTVATVSLTDRFAAFAAGEDDPGTAYAELDRSAWTTRSLVRDALDRAEHHGADLVIASLHWGPNWETAPSETQVEFARWLVEKGVDVVHGHSAHVLQGIEVYQGRPILYDCGDFVDDYSGRDGFHHERSALFEVAVSDGALAAVRAVPIEIVDEAATLAEGDVAAWVRETLRERSAAFGTSFERIGDGMATELGSS